MNFLLKAICISCGPAIRTTTTTRAVKAAMPSRTIRTEWWNSRSLSGSSLGVEAGQVGEDAGRDRLEELQRRPGDHQHVEDEAGRRGALQAADDQRPGVEEGLFAEHDQQHGGGEAAAVPEREVLRRRPPPRVRAVRSGWRCACAFCARRAKAKGTTIRRERRGGDDADRDRRLAAEDADRDQHGEDRAEARFGEDQRDEEAEALRAGEEAAGEVAGGVEEDRGEEDPVEGFVALEQVVLDRPAQGEREDREERARGRAGSSRRPASARRSAGP